MSSSRRKPRASREKSAVPAGARHALYASPWLYDLAFGYRDIPKESDGLLAIAARHGLASPRRIADIACGPAHHIREFARRGFEVYGVDLNREMVAYARHLNRTAHLAVKMLRADMRSFVIPTRVDMALCLFDSFSHCTTDADAIATLRCAARALRKDGLVILELTHPADYFARRNRRTLERWTQRYDDFTVRTRFLTTRKDPVAETYIASLGIEAVYGGTRPRKRVEDRQLHRMWLRSGISHIASASGAFDVVGWYGDLDPRVAFTLRSAAWRMVAVLRKTRSR